jgi:hypothetical protein
MEIPLKTIPTIGFDLAKNSFTVYGVNAEGRPVMQRALARAGVIRFSGFRNDPAERSLGFGRAGTDAARVKPNRKSRHASSLEGRTGNMPVTSTFLKILFAPKRKNCLAGTASKELAPTAKAATLTFSSQSAIRLSILPPPVKD